MESKKSKVFTKKLIALFLSALMAISCFTGAFTAYARGKDYHDSNLAYNFLAWAETTDEQTAEALLDWADANLSWTMKNLVGFDEYHFSQNVVVTTIKIDAYMDSVDGLIYTIEQADDLLDSYGGLIGGDVKNINLDGVADLANNYSTSSSDVVSKCGRSYRAKYTAKEILVAVAKLLYQNTNETNGHNVLRNLILGNFNLGTILGGVIKGIAGSDDIFDILKDTLGMWDNYQNDLVYNVVANLIFTNTKWYSDEELSYYKQTDSNGNLKNWNFDTQLFEALNTQLIQQINSEITYTEAVGGHGIAAESSKNRYEAFKAYAADNNMDFTDDNMGNVIAAYNAANNTTYDAKLHYTDEGNVILFRYGYGDDEQKLVVQTTSNLLEVAYDAAKIAWNTALKDTLGLVHVNYNNTDDGGSTNFDNAYYYWFTSPDEHDGKWNTADVASNYSAANVQAWINDVCEDYGKTAEEFEALVKSNLTFDRSIAADAKGNWRDIKSKSLFVKLRYSPLADYGFGLQTGPINLYFEQTGTPTIDAFMQTAFDNYSSLPAALNDLLVAAVGDIFPDRPTIGLQGAERGVVGTNLTVPTLVTTGNWEISEKSTKIRFSAETLVANALKVFEYAANAADPYIFNQYYTDHNITFTDGVYNLTEGNFEEAAIPLGIAALVQNVDMIAPIHYDDWDKVADAEGAGYLALKEYLSYVLPDRNYDSFATEVDGKYVVSFDNILRMARDAVGYVVQAYVPVRNTDDSEWNIYNTTTADDSSIWDLANSVVCYYASDHEYPVVENGASKTLRGKSVATLLGISDNNGYSLVKPSNTVWENIDIVVNSLLPILGQLQYGSVSNDGQFNSYDLIYNDIIKNVLNIGGEDGTGTGITNFLERVYTIVCSDPITSTGVDELVYDDIVVPLINNLFGPRYGNGYNQVLPTYAELNSATPFDTMLHVDWLGSYKGNGSVGTPSTTAGDLGYLSLLVANLYSALGGFDGVTAQGPTGAWTALMFAVTAVNSFIPDFVPQVGAHKFGATTASVENPSTSGLTAGQTISNNLIIKNGAIGLNRAYNTTGKVGGNIVQDDRLFVDVTSIDVAATTTTSGGETQSTTSQINLAANTAHIAPEKTVKIGISGKAPAQSVGNILYTFTVHYNVTLGDGGKVLYSNLKTKAYMYHTLEKGWAETAYNGNTLNNSTNTYTKVSSFEYYTPTNFIVPMSDPTSINAKTFYMKNTTNPPFSDGYKAMDGIFTYAKSGTKYYPVTNGSVSATQTTASGSDTTLAYAAIDRTTGDIINYDLYDYYNPNKDANGKVIGWVRGTKNNDAINAEVKDNGSGGGLGGGYMGFTDSEINGLSTTIKDAEGFATRPHVVWTFEEALGTGYVKGVDREVARVKDGVTEYIYNAVFIQPTTGLLQGNYGQNSKVSISWGTPVPGIYFGVGKNRLKKNTSDTSKVFLKYDGSSELSVFHDSVQIDMFRNKDEGKTTFNLYVADDTQAASLQQSYDADIQEMAAYQESDLSDYSQDTGSAIYQALQTGFQQAVAEISKPINEQNAASLGSDTAKMPKTGDSTKTYGDRAYQPVPASVDLPPAMLVSAQKIGDYWYDDEDANIPIYYADENHALTDADVTNGKDAVGTAVVKGDDGKWYVANPAKYEQEWDTTTFEYPILVDTDTQVKNGEGALVYKQIQFVYRDGDGKKVNSDDNPVFKLADSETVTKSNEDGTEHRSRYEQLDHNLSYLMEQVKKNVKNAADRIVENVVDDRKDLNNVNFVVANYESMVKVAKEAEGILSTEWNPVATSDTTYQYDTDYYEKKVDDNNNEYYEKVTEYNIGDEIEGTLYVYEPTYSTDASAVEIEEAIRIYNLYKSRADATHIDYDSDNNRLEAEITHASGNAYNAYTANATDEEYRFTYSTKGAHEADQVTRYEPIATTASTVRFGTVKNGVIVNEDAEGNQLYTDASWNAYIDALGAAVDTAQAGRAVASSEDAEVTDCYTAKSHLVIAENNLEEFVDEPAEEGRTVTGAVKVAKDEFGRTFQNSPVRNATVSVLNANNEVVATAETDSAGKFEIVVPADGVTMTISKYCVSKRTISLTGEGDVTDYPTIPVIVADYSSNGSWDATDKNMFNTGYKAGNLDMDLSGNGSLDATDKNIFKYFMAKNLTLNYDEFNL